MIDLWLVDAIILIYRICSLTERQCGFLFCFFFPPFRLMRFTPEIPRIIAMADLWGARNASLRVKNSLFSCSFRENLAK